MYSLIRDEHPGLENQTIISGTLKEVTERLRLELGSSLDGEGHPRVHVTAGVHAMVSTSNSGRLNEYYVVDDGGQIVDVDVTK